MCILCGHNCQDRTGVPDFVELSFLARKFFFKKLNWSSRLLCTGLTSMVYDFAIRETPRTSISTARYFPFPSRTATPCERYSTLTATLAVATLSVCMLLTTTYAAPSGVQETSNRKGKKKKKKREASVHGGCNYTQTSCLTERMQGNLNCPSYNQALTLRLPQT